MIVSLPAAGHQSVQVRWRADMRSAPAAASRSSSFSDFPSITPHVVGALAVCIACRRSRLASQHVGRVALFQSITPVDGVAQLQKVYGLKVDELKAELRKHGLKVSGRKAELQYRLLEAVASLPVPSPSTPLTVPDIAVAADLLKPKLPTVRTPLEAIESAHLFRKDVKPKPVEAYVARSFKEEEEAPVAAKKAKKAKKAEVEEEPEVDEAAAKAARKAAKKAAKAAAAAAAEEEEEEVPAALKKPKKKKSVDEAEDAAEDLQDVAKSCFGFDSFLPGQERVLDLLMSGKSAVAIFPTGGGKSLCYQLPSQLLDGLTLVVSPLIALMDDQVDAMKKKGIEAYAYHSNITPDQRTTLFEKLREGSLRLLFIAPERLSNEIFLDAIRWTKISLLAIDEAHCVSQWGHSFRPDYLRLARFAREQKAERVLALTATATVQVQEDICDEEIGFGIPPENVERTPFHRPNLYLDVVVAPDGEDARRQQLLEELRTREGATIVYVTKQCTSDEIADWLHEQGLPAKSYHAGQESALRTETQAWYMETVNGIMVATIAFGMGIDKKDTRGVIHYNLPKSIEGYVQEIGRAGRNGQPARCLALASAADVPVLQTFAFSNTPSAQSVRAFVADIYSNDNTNKSRTGNIIEFLPYRMSKAHDIRGAALTMLLAFGDIYGQLYKTLTPRWRMIQFLLAPGMESYAAVDHGELLAKHVLTKTKWSYLDMDLVPSGDRKAALDAVRDLEKNGSVTDVKFSQVYKRIEILREPDIDEFAREQHKRLLDQEANDLERLDDMVNLLGADQCQTGILMKRFEVEGPTPEFRCGHCRFCRTNERFVWPKVQYKAVDEDLWADFVADPELPKDDSRFLARIAVGMPSPRVQAEGLKGSRYFGAFEGCDYRVILERCEKVCNDPCL